MQSYKKKILISETHAIILCRNLFDIQTQARLMGEQKKATNFLPKN